MIALVAHSAGASPDGSSPAVTTAIDTTGANLIVLAATGVGSNTPTDSKSNSWHALTAQAGDFGDQLQLWWSVPTSVGAGHTFSDSDADAALSVQAFSGGAASPFDQENGVSSGGLTHHQPGPVTPTEDNEVVITAGGNVWAVGASIDSGFTITDFIGVVGGQNFSSCLAYKIQTTAGTENPTWTPTSDTAGDTLVIATFKAASVTSTRAALLPLLGVS